MFEQLHFIRPDWLWVLIPITLFLFLLWKTKSSHTTWEKICDPHLLNRLLISPAKSSLALPLSLLTAGWFLTIFALAGPSLTKERIPVYQKLDSKVIVLDLSPAMNAKDVKPSRLVRAKYKVKEILKRSKEGQTGLIVFAEEPYIVSPLTKDAKTINSMIPNLTSEIMPASGQKIGRALNFAAKMMQQAGVESGNILLISSGPITASDQNIAQKLSQKGYFTSVLSIGSEEGAPIVEEEGHLLKDSKGNILFSYCDKCGLRELANQGRGNYVEFTNSNTDIDKLFNLESDHSLNALSVDENQTNEQWQDDGIWLVFLLLPLSLIAFRRGWFA